MRARLPTSIVRPRATVGDAARPGDLSEFDAAFLDRLDAVVAEGIADPSLRADEAGRRLGPSVGSLRRKLHGLLATTFPRLLTERRMARARDLLSAGTPVSVVADKVGYVSASSFARAFRGRYGIAPTGWARRGEAGEGADGEGAGRAPSP